MTMRFVARPNIADGEYFQDIALDITEDIAQEIVDEIQSSPITPVITGTLLRGYRVEPDPGGDGHRVVNDVDYWRYVEFGTRRSEEVAHVRPAIEAVFARHGVT